MKRKGMEVAVFWLVIIGPIFIGLAGAIWYGGSKTPALWVGFSGIMLLLFAGALQLQQFISNSSNLAHKEHLEEKKMTDEKPSYPAVNIGSGGNIVTFGQSGGQNVINQAPKPDLKKLNDSTRQNPDGSQSISILTEVVAPYPPGSLSIKAIGPDILDLNVIPQRTGPSTSGHSGKREGYAFTTLMNPFGQYMIVVRTSKPEAISIEYEFQ
jgi:hypothetical protein